MAKVIDIYNYIDSIAPFETQMDFDNAGLLVGDENKDITSALLSLDITKDVLDEAIMSGSNLIISHHPVIFNPLKCLPSNSVPYLLAQNNISAICAHTNLDMADKVGVNAILGKRLKLKNIRALTFYNSCPFLMYGEIEQSLSPVDFAKYVKKCLGADIVKCIYGTKDIKTVAFCCGGASDMISSAIDNHIDAFISGDSKHHEHLLAKHENITFIDAGHFATEDIVIEPLAQLLNSQFKGVHFYKSKSNGNIINYV